MTFGDFYQDYDRLAWFPRQIGTVGRWRERT